MGDVTRAVQSVVEGAKKVANDVGAVWDRNREEAERGDLGRTTKAFARPFTGTMEATKRLVSGDFQGAGNRFTGAMLSAANPLSRVAEASPGARNFFKTKTGDIVTLGLGGDSADIAERSSELIGGRNTDSADFWTAARLGAKTAAVVAGGMNYDVLATKGGEFAAKTGTYAADNPLATALVGSKLAAGDTEGATAALLDAYEPGLGSAFIPGRTSQPENFPESAGYGDGYYQTATPGLDKNKILIVGAAVVGAALLAKGLKK